MPQWCFERYDYEWTNLEGTDEDWLVAGIAVEVKSIKARAFV